MWKSIIFLSFSVHFVMCQIVSEISTPKINTTIAPVWDDYTQSLYFVGRNTDGLQSAIYRYSYIDGVLYSARIDGVDSVSFILPAEAKCEKCKNLFVVGAVSQVITVKWNGVSTRAKAIDRLFSIDANIPLTRTGIARASPSGRFYGGAYFFSYCNATPGLSFYRYDQSDGLVRLFGNLISTSGIAFNLDAQKMYHMDSCQLFITEYDWDPKSGDICNGRVAFDFRSVGASLPDVAPLGLDIGTNGLLYTAIQTGDVWVIDPWISSLVNIIEAPINGLNGIAFGGPYRDILFLVASMNVVNLNSSQRMQDTEGSALYMVTGVGAVATPSSRVLIH